MTKRIARAVRVTRDKRYQQAFIRSLLNSDR